MQAHASKKKTTTQIINSLSVHEELPFFPHFTPIAPVRRRKKVDAHLSNRTSHHSASHNNNRAWSIERHQHKIA